MSHGGVAGLMRVGIQGLRNQRSYQPNREAVESELLVSPRTAYPFALPPNPSAGDGARVINTAIVQQLELDN